MIQSLLNGLGRPGRICVLAVGLWLLGPGATWAAETSLKVGEYQVKAAFVFNFVKFTDWPPGTLSHPHTPIVVGVVGENPFDHTLADLLRAETIFGHPLVLRQLQPGDDVTTCQVLFISRQLDQPLPALLAAVKNKPVLTISDRDRFCEQGGMVNLVLGGDRTVQPEINAGAARQAGVQISAKVLYLPMVRLVQTEH